jgi:hypothetical protein
MHTYNNLRLIYLLSIVKTVSGKGRNSRHDKLVSVDMKRAGLTTNNFSIKLFRGIFIINETKMGAI